MNTAVLAMFAALTVSAAAQSSPFNGKDLAGWETKKKDGGASKWTVGEPSMKAQDPKLFDVKSGPGAMINAAAKHGDSWDIYSTEKFGDIRLELEVMVPKGSNSGIYLMGEYEVQVYDSYGVAKPQPSDMGAIYGATVPKVNAAGKPGEWQKYVIDFRAPKFDASGNKTANAVFVKVQLNGTVIHENVEMKGPTPGGVTGKEAATGPLMFQGDHGPVAYRNIKVTPLK